MEAKKNPAVDIYRFSNLYLSIGLMITMSIIYGVFHIPFRTGSTSLEISNNSFDTEEIMDIPPTVQPPPPPPKLQLASITEAPNEVEIIEEIPIIDLEMNEQTAVESMEYNEDLDLEAPEEEKVDKIFTIVEQEAEPKGGVEAFYKYVASKLKNNYPNSAARMNIQGVVYIEFVIEKDGSITQVKAIKGIGSGCDELAIEVVENAPKWNPGKQRGVPVRSRRMVPIRFKLKNR